MSEDLPDFFTLAELIEQLSAEVGRDFSVDWDSGALAAGVQTSNTIVVPADRDYYVVQCWALSIAQPALSQPGSYHLANITTLVVMARGAFIKDSSFAFAFAKPFRALAGESITQYITNMGAAGGRFLCGFAGYYVLV